MFWNTVKLLEKSLSFRIRLLSFIRENGGSVSLRDDFTLLSQTLLSTLPRDLQFMRLLLRLVATGESAPTRAPCTRSQNFLGASCPGSGGFLMLEPPGTQLSTLEEPLLISRASGCRGGLCLWYSSP